MGSFFFIYDKLGTSNLSRIVKSVLFEISDLNVTYSDILIENHLGFGCSLINTTLESKNEQLPFYDFSSNCYIIADARIDYREELAEKLGVSWDDAKDYPDSRFILLAYLKWGEHCIDHLYGDFCFAIWDEKIKQLFGARDHFGCRPFYFIDLPKYFIISSSLSLFKTIPGFNMQIKDQSIFNAICSIDMDKSDKELYEINRLLPAHYIRFSHKQGVILGRYWDLKVSEQYISLTEEEATKELKERILDAIGQRIRTVSNLGVELSGGLDSSGIAAGLVRKAGKGKTFIAYTHAVSEKCKYGLGLFKSELHFSSYVAKEIGALEHVVVNEENKDGSFNTLIAYLQLTLKPVNQTYGIMCDLLLQAAVSKGTNIIFSGFGGDEGVTYLGNGYFLELFQKRDFRILKENLRAMSENRAGNIVLRIIKLFIKIYLPWLFKLYYPDWRRRQFKTYAINKRIRKKNNMKSRFLRATSLPSIPDVRIRQYNRLMHPILTERLENTYEMSKNKGIEYCYPFLDVKLLELFYSLPSEYKFQKGLGRYIYRSAMHNILPEKIRLRTDKAGATIPNVICRLLKDEDKYRDIIHDGKINNKFHYVDYEKILWMIDHFKQLNNTKKIKVSHRAFMSSMSVLILQKWQREGKIDIGIKC